MRSLRVLAALVLVVLGGCATKNVGNGGLGPYLYINQAFASGLASPEAEIELTAEFNAYNVENLRVKWELGEWAEPSSVEYAELDYGHTAHAVSFSLSEYYTSTKVRVNDLDLAEAQTVQASVTLTASDDWGEVHTRTIPFSVRLLPRLPAPPSLSLQFDTTARVVMVNGSDIPTTGIELAAQAATELRIDGMNLTVIYPGSTASFNIAAADLLTGGSGAVTITGAYSVYSYADNYPYTGDLVETEVPFELTVQVEIPAVVLNADTLYAIPLQTTV
jgi:hypothetical protein